MAGSLGADTLDGGFLCADTFKGGSSCFDTFECGLLGADALEGCLPEEDGAEECTFMLELILEALGLVDCGLGVSTIVVSKSLTNLGS